MIVRVPRSPWFDGLVDDNGTGNGTLWNKGQIGAQLDAIDQAFAQTDAIGIWYDQPYNASDYNADSGLVFAPTAGQIAANCYTKVAPSTLLWNLVVSCPIGGSGQGRLFLTLPGGHAAKRTLTLPGFFMRDGAGGIVAPGVFDTTSGSGFVTLTPLNAAVGCVPTSSLSLWAQMLSEVY